MFSLFRTNKTNLFDHVHTSFPGRYMCLCQHISHGTGVSLQHWLTGPRVFGVSNRHRHRCNILQSGLEIIGHNSQCVFMSHPNGSLCTGMYSVEVYDIERGGSVSSVPALAGEIVTVFGPSTVPSVDTGYIFTSCELSTRNGSSVIQGSFSNDRPFVYCKAGICS